VLAGIGPQNAPIEQMFWVCGAGSRDVGRGTFKVGERKFLSVVLFSGVDFAGFNELHHEVDLHSRHLRNGLRITTHDSRLKIQDQVGRLGTGADSSRKLCLVS